MTHAQCDPTFRQPRADPHTITTASTPPNTAHTPHLHTGLFNFLGCRSWGDHVPQTAASPGARRPIVLVIRSRTICIASFPPSLAPQRYVGMMESTQCL